MPIFSRGKPGGSSSLNDGRVKNGQMYVSRKPSRRGREEDIERPSRRSTTSRASAYDDGKDSHTRCQEEAIRIMREDYEARVGISQYETPAAPSKGDDKVKKWASEVAKSSHSSSGNDTGPSRQSRPRRAAPADEDDEDDSYEPRRPTRRAPARYDDDEDSPPPCGRPKARQQSYDDEDEEEEIGPRVEPLSFQTGGRGGGEQYPSPKALPGLDFVAQALTLKILTAMAAIV